MPNNAILILRGQALDKLLEVYKDYNFKYLSRFQVSTKTKYHDDHHDSYHDDHHGYHANIHEVYRESPDHIEVESKTVGSSSPSLAVAAATSSPSVQKQLSTAETAEQESEPQKSDQVSRALSALRALGVRGSRSRIGGRLRLRAQRARGGRGGITTTSGKRVSSRLKAIKISKPKQRKQSSETETGTALGGNSASFFPPPPRQPKHVQSAVPADIGGMGQTKAANPGLGGGFPGFPGGFEFPEFGSFTKKK